MVQSEEIRATFSLQRAVQHATLLHSGLKSVIARVTTGFATMLAIQLAMQHCCTKSCNENVTSN